VIDISSGPARIASSRVAHRPGTEAFLADLEQQDHARIVHLLVEHAHDLQQLLAAHRADR
jgi:hypothetical protein